MITLDKGMLMKNLFSLDSPIMQLLSKLMDMILLNLLFLLCCLPVVTIGAAQAGLMTAVRAMQAPDDDSSWLHAFFRGFRGGFGKITLLWTAGIVGLFLLAQLLFASISIDGTLDSFAVFCAGFGLLLLAMLLTMAVAFHSRFDCSIWQIVRSSWFLTFLHLPRAIAATVLIWAPPLLAAWNLTVFVKMLPLWALIYYAAAFMLCFRLIKPLFNELETQFFPEDDGNSTEM